MKSTDPHSSHAHPDLDMPEGQGVPEVGTGPTSIDPVASMQAIDNPALHAVAGQVRDLLAKVVAAV